MHRSDLDPQPSISTSPIHRLSPAVKVGLAIAVIISVVSISLQHAWYLVPIALFIGTALLLSRISIPLVLRRLILLEPLAIGVAVLSLFQPGGWRVMLLILAKCTLCFLTTILLGATTSISELVNVLRAVRIPSLMITTMLLMHRYLFVLIDESSRMRRARASRTFVARRRFEWRTLSTVIGQLFVRSAERADRVYAAMCARGWR